LAGMAVDVWGDSEPMEGELQKLYPRKQLGHIFAILGGVFTGVSDTFIEKSVNVFGGGDEYLGIVGFFGIFMASIQAIFFERQFVSNFFHYDENAKLIDSQERDVCKKSERILLVPLFVFSLYFLQVGKTKILGVSETALLTLSLLTVNFWAAGYTIVAENIYPVTEYWIALILIIFGMFIYKLAPSPLEPVADAQKLR